MISVKIDLYVSAQTKRGIRKMAKALLPAKIFVDMNARFRLLIYESITTRMWRIAKMDNIRLLCIIIHTFVTLLASI